MTKEIPKWRNSYQVLAPEDHDLLDANAAVKEFRGGMTKEGAAEEAHRAYLKNHALDSAVHHYLGMRAALTANNSAAAKQHGEMFAHAMNHLGFNPTGPLPEELQSRVKAATDSPYSFKAHKADTFFEPKVEIPGVEKETTPEQKTVELLAKLKSLRSGQKHP